MDISQSNNAYRTLKKLIETNPNLNTLDQDMAMHYFESSFADIDSTLGDKEQYTEWFELNDFLDWVFHFTGLPMQAQQHIQNMMELLAVFYNQIFFHKKIWMGFCTAKDHVVVCRESFLEKQKPKHNYYDSDGADDGQIPDGRTF